MLAGAPAPASCLYTFGLFHPSPAGQVPYRTMRRPHSHKARPHWSSLRRPGALLLLIAWIHAAPAAAQRFGQWWWDGMVGLGERSYDNEIDGTKTSGYDQRDLLLSLGLHGYVIHPALARFSLKSDLAVSQIEGGRGLDSQQLGFGAELELTPRGSYPTRLFAHRQRFDYKNLDEEDPFTLAAVPQTATSWGLRSRIRRGPARGLLTGLERSELNFLDPTIDTERRDRQFLDWNRRFGALQHHMRLEHRLRNYAAVALEIEDTTLTIDDHAELGGVWNWTMSGLGIQRTITVPQATTGFGVDDYRVRNQASRPVRKDDLLDIQYQVAAVRPELGDDSLGHDLRLFYRWRPRPVFELAPFVQYFRQAFDSRTVTSPRAGVAATWRGPVRMIKVLATVQASFGRTSTNLDSGAKVKQNEAAFGGNLNLSHGSPQRLRQELELELSRNDLRVDSAPVVDVPEFGLPLAGVLDQSSERIRLTLEHRRQALSLTGWTEWQRREIRGDFSERAFDSDNLSATLQLSGRTWSILGNAGRIMTRREKIGDQTVDFVGGSVSWRPFRALEIYGGYRTDTRELFLVPNVNGERWQAGARFHLGQLSFEGLIFSTSETLMDGPDRRNSGFRFAITRRFAGWLPIVTAPERRGVIR